MTADNTTQQQAVLVLPAALGYFWEPARGDIMTYELAAPRLRPEQPQHVGMVALSSDGTWLCSVYPEEYKPQNQPEVFAPCRTSMEASARLLSALGLHSSSTVTLPYHAPDPAWYYRNKAHRWVDTATPEQLGHMARVLIHAQDGQNVPAKPDYSVVVGPELRAILAGAFNAAYPKFLESLSIGSYAPKPPAKQAEQVAQNVPAKPESEPSEPLPQVGWAEHLWHLYGEAQTRAARLNAQAFALENNQDHTNINRLCTVCATLGDALNTLGNTLSNQEGWLHTRLNLLHAYLQEITITTRFVRGALASNNGVSAKEYSSTIGATAHNICRLLEECRPELDKLATPSGAR